VRNVGRYKIEYVAEQVGVAVRTVHRWLKRYIEEGKEGLQDKSKRPHTYGVPREIITNYGSKFYAVRGGVSTFDIFCLQNEIKHILARVRHPETHGKVERRMREVKVFLASINYTPANMSADELKKEIEQWVVFHNYSRIHFAYQYYQFDDVMVRKKL